MANRLLLVEGEADRGFFELLCKSQAILAEIQVAPPIDIGGKKNSKQGVLNLLDTLIGNLEDGSLQTLAIVVDADRSGDNKEGGFENTICKIEGEISAFGYDSPPVRLSAAGGLLYKHNDGLADFGAWVMPNNADEGSLEDWIKQSVSTAESNLFQQAQATVAGLSEPKFKLSRLSKAEIATWLAWQEKPGEGLYYTVQAELLDSAAPLHIALVNWLSAVFSPTSTVTSAQRAQLI